MTFMCFMGKNIFCNKKNKKYQIETKRYVIKFETIVYIALTFIVFIFAYLFFQIEQRVIKSSNNKNDSFCYYSNKKKIVKSYQCARLMSIFAKFPILKN